MKQHTIIFVPHARAKFRKWRLTTLQAALALGGLCALTLGALVATALYFGSDFDRDELDRVARENAELREANERFESSLRELEVQLGDYQQRIHKLAIVAGVAELSPGGEPGIGGLEPPELTPFETLEALEQEMSGMDLGMNELELELGRRQIRLSSTPTIAPAAGILTSGFGYRRDPFTGRRAFHAGLDVAAPHGGPVRAPGDAVVVKAGRAGGYGKVVYLSHGNGLTTRYGHLSAIEVEPGERVRRGDVIGRVGSTGRSTGTHLHYEVRVNGKPADPLAYILDDPAS
ncbi:MAG: M23 family metallopeptidase [Acidobacteriota bacterium]